MRESFVFYSSYYEALAEFDEIIQAHLFKVICEYALYGTIPELSGIEKALFTLIKPTIDSNEKRYNNGKKGGRPKKTNGFENEKPTVINSETNGFENEKPNVNVNDNVNANVNVNETGNEDFLPGKPDDVPSSSEPKKKKKSNIPKHPEAYEEIISHLNHKANTLYRPSSTSNQKYIDARLNEGYTVENFITVIDKKCAEWIGTDMEKFLRPETLFGNKFESYLNQNVIQRSEEENESFYGYNPENAPF